MNNGVVYLEKMYEDVVVPAYKHEGDSGMDIRAYFSEEFKTTSVDYIAERNALHLRPRCRILVPTGIKVAIQNYEYEIQVRPRSGLALKSGITVLNTPGTIDASYRGEIGVILFNSNECEDFFISHGDRVAQIVLAPVLKIDWVILDKLDLTSRSDGGFGSTGVS